MLPSPPSAASIEDRVALWKDFYARRNERPLLGFFLGSEYPLRRYPASTALPEGRALRPGDFKVEAYLDDHETLFEAHEACGGDFIWSADAFWGIQWIECLCGLEMFANHASGNLHFRKPADFRGADDIPESDPEGPWARLAAEFLRKGAARAAGRYPFGTTRMRGITDMLSALYGPQDFVYALIDDPGGVRAVCEKICTIYTAFARFQLAHIPVFHGGIGSFYYSNWAPPGTVCHQEDAAVMLSPALYREHIREWDAKIVGSFEHSILHLHSVGFRPLDDYLAMGFAAAEERVRSVGGRVHAMRLIANPAATLDQATDAPNSINPLYGGREYLLPTDHPHNAANTMNHHAIGILETQGLTAALHATDTMLKAADVSLVGKEKIGAAYVAIIIRGDVAAVEAALRAGESAVGNLGKLIAAQIIARPHEDFLALLPAKP